jgi:molecular chaperone GrpE
MVGGPEGKVRDTESRDLIMARFERWLDTALASEEPPAGIDAEILAAVVGETSGETSGETTSGEATPGEPPRADSYALWSAMTALTQEVKLQGRAFQDLARIVEAQPGALAEELGESSRAREREVQTRAQRETERRCWKDALRILIDLEDRLSRGLESVRAAQHAQSAASSGWLSRIFSKKRDAKTSDVTGALVRGYELAIERVAQAFEEVNAHPIQCIGARFDPRTMNAIDREESAVVAEGSVLEVYKSGYEWNGEVLRPAQVKVACAPARAKRDE